MAKADYKNRVREILSGYSVGEKPPLRRCAASANVSVSGDVVTFDLFAGEGDKVKAGHVLSLWNPTDESDSYVFYVLSVSTDTVTAVNGYEGAPAIANASAALDSAVLEQLGGGMPSNHAIFQAIDTVFGTLLYPHVHNYGTGTLTPSLSELRSEVPANVEAIIDSWQEIGSDLCRIPLTLKKNQHSTISSTGNLVIYDAVNGSTVYYSYRERLAVGDESTYPHLVELVALGAAALLADATRPETQLARSSQDSRERGQGADVGSILWRDFLQLRDQWADDLARENVIRINVDRG